MCVFVRVARLSVGDLVFVVCVCDLFVFEQIAHGWRGSCFLGSRPIIFIRGVG